MADTPSREMRYGKALEFAERQVRSIVAQGDRVRPVHTVSGRWHGSAAPDAPWTSGFLAGMMWQFVERHGDGEWAALAERYSRPLEHFESSSVTHDLGLIFLPTYLPWFRRSNDRAVHDALLAAGKTMAGRFHPRSGFYASSVGADILRIEQMASIPLVFYTANETLDQDIARCALRHCRTTKKFLVQDDGAVRSGARFELEAGKPVGPDPRDSIPDDWCWSRGLAWSLVGFTRVFELTEIREMLSVAQRNAEFWMQRTADDPIPAWHMARDESAGAGEFESVQHRDASAAAIAAAGLLDLSDLAGDSEFASRCRHAALTTLDRLVDPDYLAADTLGWEGIVKHAVYDARRNLGVDESVIWGDYFLVESLTKALRLPDLAS